MRDCYSTFLAVISSLTKFETIQKGFIYPTYSYQIDIHKQRKNEKSWIFSILRQTSSL